MEKHLQTGTTDQCLHSFTPQPGDCIFLPAGTVHAVGGGVVIAEVQQTSDATFRLFDWNRVGTDGKSRTLHLDESLASINWQAGPVHPVKGKALPALPAGASGEHLVSCPFFELRRYRVEKDGKLGVEKMLSIWMVLGAAGWLRQRILSPRFDREKRCSFRRAPAPASGRLVTGRDLLDVRVPADVA